MKMKLYATTAGNPIALKEAVALPARGARRAFG